MTMRIERAGRDGQPSFRPCNVVLVGCGGTGGWLAEPLARLLAFHPGAAPFREAPGDNLLLVDGDRWESRNRERQACRSADVGLHKVTTLAERVAAMELPDVRPWSIEEYLRTVDDVDLVLRNLPTPLLVICAVDNMAARVNVLRWLDEFCEGDWAFVSPGNGTGDVRGQVVLDGCVAGCALTASLLRREQYANPDDTGQPATVSCAAAVPDAPQLITANMLAATLTLHVVHGLLTGGDFYQETMFDVHESRGLRVYTDGDRIPARRLNGDL